MSVLIKHMAMPKGCIYANDKDQTEYCPLLNHDDVPFCQYIENEPEIAIGIDERPVYCPLSDVPDKNVGDIISRQAAIDIFDDYNVSVENGDLEAYSRDRKRLCELPSAQPEPCEDAVSRHRLLSDLKELIVAWEKYPVMAEQIKGVETAIGYVKTIPSVTPKQRWIPCSERLPEYGKSVLCYFKEDEDFSVNHVIDEEDGEWFINGVTAWMPLPEPYREEGGK